LQIYQYFIALYALYIEKELLSRFMFMALYSIYRYCNYITILTYKITYIIIHLYIQIKGKKDKWIT